MGEVSLDDREILQQIMYLVSRLGPTSNHATTETPLGTKETPTTQNPSESMLDGKTTLNMEQPQVHPKVGRTPSNNVPVDT